MNTLDHLVDRHPIATGTVGSVLGLLSPVFTWLLDHVGQIQQVAGAIGAILGATCSGFTLFLLIRRARRPYDPALEERYEREDDDF